MDVMELLTSTLIQGLIYALISYGVYITYSILDFPDLGVDGTFPLGAAVTAVLMTKGVDPWLTLPASLIVGGLAGLFTGLVHVKLKVRNLLAGIITMTALFSVNLQIAGSNLTIDRGTDTIFTSAPVMALFGDLSLSGRKLIVSLALVIVIKLLLDAYFHTKSGLLLRAVGDNATLVTTLAKDRGTVKILGLVISNALVAFGGCIVCHETRSFSATMGTGQLVYGLAAVIISEVLFEKICAGRKIAFAYTLFAVFIGAILYYVVIGLVLWLKMPSDYMKLFSAVVVACFLSIPYLRQKYLKKKGVVRS